MRNNVLLASVCAVALSGCITDGTPEIAADKALYEHKKAVVDDNSSKIPGWFLEPPREDDTVFSVGTAVMPDMQLSIDVARLSAKEQLADRIYSKLRSQTKTYIAKVGTDDLDASVLNEVEKATKNIVADAEVNGYEQREVVIEPMGVQYRSFVLLAFNAGEAAKLIRNRIATARAMQSKFQSATAWKELDKVAKEVKNEERGNAVPRAVPVAPVTVESN